VTAEQKRHRVVVIGVLNVASASSVREGDAALLRWLGRVSRGVVSMSWRPIPRLPPYWLTNTATSAARLYWQLSVSDRGAHFAAWEQPQLFSEELRAAFRTLCCPRIAARRAEK
jgi:hypothetical protein